VGWKARKSPAVAGVFFLDFPFYRTSQELTVAIEESLVFMQAVLDLALAWIRLFSGA
jgi:hypothetical protein